jgi:hypothetical protein
MPSVSQSRSTMKGIQVRFNVKYDNYGEIKQVDSKQGHKMALQVTQAFQNLTEYCEACWC